MNTKLGDRDGAHNSLRCTIRALCPRQIFDQQGSVWLPIWALVLRDCYEGLRGAFVDHVCAQ